MKAIWFVFIFMLCGNCYAQEVNKVSVDTLKVKGYVVIYTNEKNDMGDTSFWYFFVKLNDMEEGFNTAFNRGKELVRSGELFFISPLISDDINNSLLNNIIKNDLKIDNLKLQDPKINPRKFYNDNNVVYSFKGTNIYFKLYYVDGIFIKINSPRKFRLMFSTHFQLRYMSDLVDYYNLYFLIDTKVVGYNIHCNDLDLILHKG